MKTYSQVLLTSNILKTKEKELFAFLEKNLPNVRNFEGCHSVWVYYNSETATMIFNEEWESKEHHKKYIDFISKNGVMNQLIAFLEEPPMVEYYQKLAL
ncbi:hypothetical protein [Kordia sp.]|uniref:hypothetical protein n=1 Tax=Kordia sp. TaxID=1965332 RepID=UPI003B5BB89A